MAPLRFKYQTLEIGGMHVHVRGLLDKQQFQDDEDEALDLGISDAQWSLFGVLWGSSHGLALLMASYEVEGKRILEVGCGLGLASLVLTQRSADVTATDLHPEAGRFLAFNSELNGHDPVPFIRAGWLDEHDDLGRFDLIIGSDLLYEPDHPQMLSGFIDRHAAPACEVILLDPGRKQLNRFGRCMEALGYTLTRQKMDAAELSGRTNDACHVLRFRRGLPTEPTPLLD